MCAYSTDRTHIRVCSIVVFFAEFDRGVFCGCRWGVFPTRFHEQNQVPVNGNMRGVLLQAPKANGTFLERYTEKKCLLLDSKIFFSLLLFSSKILLFVFVQ
jgi:hypothetical protein